MTYNQHYSGSTPGAIASKDFDDTSIRLTLPYFSAKKLFLGIPSYGYHWRYQKYNKLPGESVGYEKAKRLALENNIDPKWDARAQVPYFEYSKNNVTSTVYYEDARSFKVKYNIAKQYRLRGFSVWTISAMAPEDWSKISDNRRGQWRFNFCHPVGVGTRSRSLCYQWQ